MVRVYEQGSKADKGHPQKRPEPDTKLLRQKTNTPGSRGTAFTSRKRGERLHEIQPLEIRWSLRQQIHLAAPVVRVVLIPAALPVGLERPGPPAGGGGHSESRAGPGATNKARRHNKGDV